MEDSLKQLSLRGKLIEAENRPFVMGILNITPDSFSDGGLHMAYDDAMYACEKMVKEGADIIDVGGESTRPSGTPISADEELQRIFKISEQLIKSFDTMFSIDTYKAVTASEMLKLGFHIVNDVTALHGDEQMAATVAEYGDAGLVLMRNGKFYSDNEGFIPSAAKFLEESMKIALASGIDRKNLIIDPGIGFDTDREQDMKLIGATSEFKNSFNLPYLFAASRKRVTAYINGGNADNETLDGITAELNMKAYLSGADIVRTHNVLKTYERFTFER